MTSRKKTQIIYLNGASSSGKTTLAKALQDSLKPPFLHIGIDRLIGMMPEKVNNWEGRKAKGGFWWKKTKDATGQTIHEIQLGPYAKKISALLKKIVLTCAKEGHCIIIDDVASQGIDDVKKWKKALFKYKVLYVGLTTPLSVVEMREKVRKDRILGSARAQHTQVHRGVEYDLEIDTSTTPLHTCVTLIKKAL